MEEATAPMQPAPVRRSFVGRVALAWRRLFRHPQWNIGVVDRPIHTFLDDPHPPIQWFPLTGRRAFLADPFGLVDESGATVVCEHYDYRRARGSIVHVRLEDGAFVSAPAPALNSPVHLSYPCLVEAEGTVYCVPEALEAREVALYRADRFPSQWTKLGVLVDDVAAVDPTVFSYDGRWWLACVDGDGASDEKLLLFHAPRLDGPWTPHTRNPVKHDARSSRPAGTPFVHDGRLYRPAQDCSRAYGSSIVLNEVRRLSSSEFEEVPVAMVDPAPGSRFSAGRHTLSSLGSMTLVDGHRTVFVGVAFLQFLRILARDALRSGGAR